MQRRTDTTPVATTRRDRTFVLGLRLAATRDEPAWSTYLLEQTVRSSSLVREVKEVFVTTGTVKKVISDRGFGFITAEDGKEYFFHRGALDTSLDFDRLNGGEKVEFDIEQSPKGPRASRVHAAGVTA